MSIVIDIETINDPDLGPDQWDDGSFRSNTHVPVCIGVLRTWGPVPLAVEVLDSAKEFWSRWSKAQPRIITFNGRRFDIPVLEAEAMRKAISVPDWFKDNEKSWRDPRARFNNSKHFDLYDFFGGNGSYRCGTLDFLARQIGFPGKIANDGGDVAQLWADGEHDRVRAYCVCDVLDTFGLYLRANVMMGKIDDLEEEEHISQARALAMGAFDRWGPPLDNYVTALSAHLDDGQYELTL